MVILTFVFFVNIVFNAEANAVSSLLSSEQSEPQMYYCMKVFNETFKG